MKDSKNAFGVNMKAYCRAHDAQMRSALEQDRVTPELLTAHREMLARIQHERLIHLIVTVMVVLAELFTLDLVLLHPELGVIPAIVMLGITILLAFYFYHYFFLENTVQRWYKYADEMKKRLDEQA